MFFYESELGQLVYSWRSKSVEPLFEQIKDVFGIDPPPVRGFDKARVRPPLRAAVSARRSTTTI